MATSGNKHDLPVLLSVLAHGSDHKALEELMKNNVQKLQGSIGLSGLVNMLRSLSGVERHKKQLPSLKSFTAAVLRESVARSQKTLLHSPDLLTVVAAAKKDPKALKRLLVTAASPALIASVQSTPLDSPWKQAEARISCVLGPFVKARVEVPRLEAACAARLMGMLGRVCNLSDVCGFAAILLKFRAHSLLAMPSFLEVFAAKLGIVVSSPASSSDTGVVRGLCEKLLVVVGKNPPVSSGDTQLDTWVQRLEALALDKFQSSAHDSGAIRDCIEKGLVEKCGSGMKDALGDGWLNVLLVRCRKIVWLGGQNIRCESPKPTASVKSFALAAYSLLGAAARAKVDALETEEDEHALREQKEEETPRKKPRLDSKEVAIAKEQTPTKEPTLAVRIGEDKQMGETLVGTYVVSGSNHERNVFSRSEGEPVLIYYWDERDGEDQAGWWFGPEVGGEEVWAHHSDSAMMPPEQGWTMLHSGETDPAFRVEVVREACASTMRSRSREGEPAKLPEVALNEYDDGNPLHGKMKTWLKELDGGAGEMLVYFDVLVKEFEADFSQIAAAKIEGDHADVLDYVDVSFWQTVAVDNLEHRLLFAEGIKYL